MSWIVYRIVDITMFFFLLKPVKYEIIKFRDNSHFGQCCFLWFPQGLGKKKKKGDWRECVVYDCLIHTP